ncbi:DUF2029 domain-containing protein [Raineyella fluvialis]|uniref:DUF2029 domain-containing protein n=1 Tax=Raineyella fluvialis TaxID=2662261 RepID=A0A5Q2FEJ2_9ACTN|nr:DUF2029 domain-containing protein [Raineyella fluvialis]
MHDQPTRYPGFWLDRSAKVALPIIAGLVSWFIPLVFTHGWPHGGMADFDIYLEGARTALQGGELYRSGPDAFVYPPIAAVLFLPFMLGPVIAWKILWAVAGWLGIIAVVHRFGLRSWPASVVAAACIATATPVTLGTQLGQIELILTCLVVLDLVDGPHLFGRRLLPLPQGWMVGLMTAIKLTPGLFILHLLINRRWKPAITAAVTAAVLTAIGFLVYPQLSLFYWKRLLLTRSVGFESDPVYIDNQSFEGAALRLFRLSHLGAEVGTVMSVLTIVVGLIAAWSLVRQGHEAPAVAVIGIATALASPVSWTHHFVWIVPLAVALAMHHPTRPVGFSGALFVVWVWIAPYRVLKGGGMLELTYTHKEAVFSAVTPFLGLLLLIASLFAGFRQRPARHRRDLRSTDLPPTSSTPMNVPRRSDSPRPPTRPLGPRTVRGASYAWRVGCQPSTLPSMALSALWATAILRGLAASATGMVRTRTPSVYSASMFSAATPLPRVSWRANWPTGRSRVSHWTPSPACGLRSARMVSCESSRSTSIVAGSTPGRSILTK